MPDSQAYRAASEPGAVQREPGIQAVLFTVLVVVIMASAAIGARYWFRGDVDIIHGFLILFFSVNLVVCYWELCLFLKPDHVARRAEYWRRRWQDTGKTPAVEFLAGKVPLTKVLSATVWADVWATYSQYDDSYADRRTYGYNVDVGNGFVTPLPTLVLYVALTFDILPALVAGMIGMMLFWQLLYATSIYWVSFFIAKRQHLVSRRAMFIYIWGTNSPWILGSLLGLYVSVRLILDGDYSVLGY